LVRGIVAESEKKKRVEKSGFTNRKNQGPVECGRRGEKVRKKIYKLSKKKKVYAGGKVGKGTDSGVREKVMSPTAGGGKPGQRQRRNDIVTKSSS